MNDSMFTRMLKNLHESKELKEGKDNHITFDELVDTMVEANRNGQVLEGVIVFTEDSFNKPYSEESRSYKVDNENSKYLMSNMLGSSIFGNCLDGTDQGVRLDQYIDLLRDDGKGWKIDYCYLLDDVKTESKKLTEDTVSDLDLEKDNEEDVAEGTVDDVVAVVDPDLTSDDYEKVITKAEQTIEETPEGEQPADSQYVGDNIYTCPICGNAFFTDVELGEGDACPVCSEVPEAFIYNGKVDNGLTDEDQELMDNLEDEVSEEPINDEDIGDEYVEEPTEEAEIEKEEIPEEGETNKE